MTTTTDESGDRTPDPAHDRRHLPMGAQVGAPPLDPTAVFGGPHSLGVER